MASVDGVAESPLSWSARYNLVHGSHEGRLQGDKIVLPPSALEQLISASTVTISNGTNTNGFSRGGYHEYPAFAPPERQQNLPHPLMFRLVNPTNGNVAYCGVREFTAEEGEVEISAYLRTHWALKSRKTNLCRM